jgi:hypothetical protein
VSVNCVFMPTSGVMSSMVVHVDVFMGSRQARTACMRIQLAQHACGDCAPDREQQNQQDDKPDAKGFH